MVPGEPPLALIVVDVPQIDPPPVTVTVDGVVITVIGTVAVFIQPSLAVPVTVYVVELVAVTITDAPDVEFKPVEGDHVYEGAPLAVKVKGLAEQFVADDGDTFTVGVVRTVTITELVFEHEDKGTLSVKV